jgi:biotin/methionine sulfoxide reductase
MTPAHCPSLSHWRAFAALVDGSRDVHGHANDLTEDRSTSRLAQGASALSALVDIACWPGETPAMRVAKHPPPTR